LRIFCAFFQVSHWSQKWFTHFFLFVVVFGYSLLGAFIFMAIESPHEQAIRADFFREKVSRYVNKQSHPQTADAFLFTNTLW
jgi:hypothetical protein